MIQILAALLTAQPALPAVCSESACIYEDGVLIVAGAEDEARLAHDAVTDGRRRFHAAFDVMPGRTALVLDPDMRPEAIPQVEASGFDTVVPWLSPARTAEFVAPRLREVIAVQMEGAPEPVVEAMIAAQLTAHSAAGYETLAHEAGHLWFAHGWEWPEPVFRPEFYAVAAAPDWLDELAAVAAEGDTMTSGRRTRLCQSQPASIEGSFLVTYFAMEHPTFNAPGGEVVATLDAGSAFADAMTESAPATVTVTVRDSGDGQATEPGEIFYELARGLLDYAADRSGGAPLWGDLTGEIAAGGDFDAWLSRRGPAYGLPGDVDALAADFSAWLDEACD